MEVSFLEKAQICLLFTESTPDLRLRRVMRSVPPQLNGDRPLNSPFLWELGECYWDSTRGTCLPPAPTLVCSHLDYTALHPEYGNFQTHVSGCLSPGMSVWSGRSARSMICCQIRTVIHYAHLAAFCNKWLINLLFIQSVAFCCEWPELNQRCRTRETVQTALPHALWSLGVNSRKCSHHECRIALKIKEAS